MNVIENFGLYLVRAFGFLAQWLGTATAPLPWPLVMAIAAVPLLFIANLIIWFLRGTVWPVRCKYPVTTKRAGGDSACRKSVAGEWNYCRHHNKRKTTDAGKIIVDPRLPRWQTIQGGERVDRTDIRTISSSVSLLFYRGFTRSPRQVREAIPSVLSELKVNFNILVRRLKRQPIEEPPSLDSASIRTPSAFEQGKYIAFDARSERADQALYVLKWILPFTFVMVAASTFIDSSWTVILEYAALLMLWIVVEITRKGLLQSHGEMNWRIQVLLGTLKGFGVVVAVAIIAVLLDDYILPFIERVIPN